MLTTKQRAILRSMAVEIDTILQIGKGGISEHVMLQISDALTARELIKISVLENAQENTKFYSEKIQQLIKCDIVQVIGRKIIIYKKNEKKTIIQLPKG